MRRSPVQRRAKDLPADKTEQEKEQECAPNRSNSTGGRPVRPQAEDQPKEHQNPVGEGEGHPSTDQRSAEWFAIRLIFLSPHFCNAVDLGRGLLTHRRIHSQHLGEKSPAAASANCRPCRNKPFADQQR